MPHLPPPWSARPPLCLSLSSPQCSREDIMQGFRALMPEHPVLKEKAARFSERL